MKNEAKSIGKYKSDNNKKLGENTKTTYNLFGGKLIDVYRDNGHVIANKDTLKQSADQECIDIGDLQNGLNYNCTSINGQNKLPILR